jgi:hypothetical protein
MKSAGLRNNSRNVPYNVSNETQIFAKILNTSITDKQGEEINRFNGRLSGWKSRSFMWSSTYTRGTFAKFVDSPYYSESDLCGGAVTVSFSKYLPWQATHFLQCSTQFSKMELQSLKITLFMMTENLSGASALRD